MNCKDCEIAMEKKGEIVSKINWDNGYGDIVYIFQCPECKRIDVE